MSDLEKSKREVQKIDLENKVIHLADGIDLRHGDRFINDHGSILYIDFNGDVPYMKYVDDNHTYGEFTDYNMGSYAKIEVTDEELDKEVFDIVSGKKSIEDLEDILNDTSSIENGNQLVHLKSSDSLIRVKNELSAKRNHARAIYNRLGGILNSKKHKLYAIMEKFNEKLEKIHKVLYTIELYLGVNEDVIQLVEGSKAPIDSPICLRQQILYMDEEVGVYDNGGLGFMDIKKFDEWISDHFKELLPEEKGVVVFRVRRNEKDYHDKLANAINAGYDM